MKKSVAFIAVIVLLGVVYLVTHKPGGQPRPHASSATASSSVTSTATPHKDAQLQQTVQTWASRYGFDSTVVVTELTGKLRTASLGVETQMVTASTYKVYVAYATLHEVEQGKLTLTTPTRTGQTVQQALDKMILQSDNDSAEALGFLVGWDTINQLAADVGATHTDINNYDSSGNATLGDKHSTAGDLALMLTKLQQGKLLNATHTKMLLNLMENQVWRERVPAGVPSGVTVADKPGWLPDVQNDAAIVYGPKSTYILVVMTTSDTTQPLADLSQSVYTELEN